jgi:hypothetical protein
LWNPLTNIQNPDYIRFTRDQSTLPGLMASLLFYQDPLSLAESMLESRWIHAGFDWLLPLLLVLLGAAHSAVLEGIAPGALRTSLLAPYW